MKILTNNGLEHFYNHIALKYSTKEQTSAAIEDAIEKITPASIGAVPLSGAIMTGTLTLAGTDGLKTPHADGWKTDNYGSFIHTSANTSSYWCIKSNANSPVFKVWYESGNLDVTGTVTAAKVVGAVYA